MSTVRPAAIRTQYQARPGRRAIVVTDLADLLGPTTGTVELPLWLYWSGPSLAFDLADAFMRRWLYQTVLREAARPEDLTSHLNRDTSSRSGRSLNCRPASAKRGKSTTPYCAPAQRPDARHRLAPPSHGYRAARGERARIRTRRRQRTAGARA
jgi:hypothetical protein